MFGWQCQSDWRIRYAVSKIQFRAHNSKFTIQSLQFEVYNSKFVQQAPFNGTTCKWDQSVNGIRLNQIYQSQTTLLYLMCVSSYIAYCYQAVVMDNYNYMFSPQDCKNTCKTTTNCLSWTFDMLEETCILFSVLPSLPYFCNMCFSGPVNC